MSTANSNNGTTGTMKALRQLEYAKPLEVCEVPIPEAGPGVAVVRVLAAAILSYMKDIYNGNRAYPYPTPLTGGTGAVGRVHSFGPDATSLTEGQLVLLDITFRSRDQPRDVFLSAIHEGYTPGSKTLMSHWRDGAFAEYVAVPLETVYPINESIVSSPSNHTVADLLPVLTMCVPHGGLVDINLLPSETVVIAPATGPFGSAAVHLALSRGARVIAVGRNENTLAQLKSTYSTLYPPSRLITVPIAPDSTVESLQKAVTDAAAPQEIDVFFDISPPVAADSPHFKACIMALRHSGRVSLMGGQRKDLPLPAVKVMHWNLTMKGKWMYERDDVRSLIRAVEIGSVPIGKDGGMRGSHDMKAFGLAEWQEAFDWAEENAGISGGAYFKFGDW